tara:strand:+ start:802 stop:1101 length:300 start_codon:yes stop_codon:yes gene_type:complete
MPMYEFTNTRGEEKEFFFNMSDAPDIGSTVEDEDGNEWTRVSSFLVDAGMDQVVHGYPYVSRSAPRNAAGAKCNKQGMPIITSRRHEREYAKRHSLTRD